MAAEDGDKGRRVALPRGAEPPMRVFVNGIRQQEGTDYTIEDDHLLFTRDLVKERVGFWRWTAMFFALFGSYGRNDSVDVHYRLGERGQVAAGLQIDPPAEGG